MHARHASVTTILRACMEAGAVADAHTLGRE